MFLILKVRIIAKYNTDYTYFELGQGPVNSLSTAPVIDNQESCY